MTRPTAHQLSMWTDADDLVDALGRVREDQRDDLQVVVETLVEHADPDVREEALRVLCVLWKAPELHERALEALLHDPEPEVRAAASYAVAATSLPESRKGDVKAFLEVLYNERQPAFVRGTAYDGLLILYQRPKFPTMQREFRPKDDVDWDWVRAVDAQGPGQ